MKRKVGSILFLVTSIVIGVGAFGHASQWHKTVLPALGQVGPGTIRLLAYIWYFVSGAMLLIGFLLVLGWVYAVRGRQSLGLLPWAVGLYYCVFGIYGAIYLGAFFLLFIVEAAVLCGSTWLMRVGQRT